MSDPHSMGGPMTTLGPDPTWDQLGVVYRSTDGDARGGTQTDAGLPAAAKLSRPRNRRWASAARIVETALLFTTLSAATTGRIDAALIPVAVGLAFSWVWARVAASSRQRATAAAVDRDVTHALRRQALSIRATARGWATATGLLGTLTGLALAGTLARVWMHAQSQTPALARAFIPWLLVTACGAALTTWSLRRALAHRREQAAHAQLSEEFELEGVTTEAIDMSFQRRPIALLGFVGFVAVTGALLSTLVPDNAPDSPGNVLVITDDPEAHDRWLSREFDLHATQMSPQQAWNRAASLFHGDPDQLETLTTLADLEGYGFVLVDLTSVDLDLRGRSDVTASAAPPANPRFLALATGDVSLAETGWGGAGPTRPLWVSLGPLPASFGASPPWLTSNRVATRVAMMRALVSQPAFGDPTYDEERPVWAERGKSATLLRGVVEFDLPTEIWRHMVLEMDGLERDMRARRVPPRWSAP